MESGEDKAIRDMIGRAEQEKNNLLQEINNLITIVLPTTTDDIRRELKTYKDVAKQMNLNFQANEETLGVIDIYISNLTALKSELQELKINEETLLEKDSVLDKAQEILPLILPSLTRIKNEVCDLCKNNLIESYNKKEEVKSQITDLKIEKRYLEGQLDTIKSQKGIMGRKKRKEEMLQIEQKVNELYSEIQILEHKLLECDFHEEDATPQKDSDVVQEQVNSKDVECQESQSIEENDSTIDDDTQR